MINNLFNSISQDNCKGGGRLLHMILYMQIIMVVSMLLFNMIHGDVDR